MDNSSASSRMVQSLAMSSRPGHFDQARHVLTLAAPLVLTQIGMVLYSTVDMLFVGRLGPASVGAVGLCSVTYFTAFVVGMGVVMGIDSHSSKAFGAGRVDLCGQLLAHTLVLALACAVPTFLLLSAAPWAFRLVGVDAATVELARQYLSILRWCLFPGLCFVACRQFLQSISVTTPLLWAIALGNAVNALLDAALVFGALGAPKLGVPGSALATLAANLVMFAVTAAAARRRLVREGVRFHGWHRRLFWDVFSLGLPGGMQMLVEVAIFALVSALCGRLGAVPLAAHQLTLNLASMTFMVPAGLSYAAAARVGQALGRGDAREAVGCGRSALAMAVSFMAVSGICFAAVPRWFFGLFGAGDAIVAVGTPLLYCSAAFQVFDGAQIAYTGALRGMGETQRPMWFNIVGHWLVGLPVGAALCFKAGWGATGLWTGLVAGLVCVAALLNAEWRRREAELLARSA